MQRDVACSLAVPIRRSSAREKEQLEKQVAEVQVQENQNLYSFIHKKESHLFTIGSMLIIKYSHAVTAVFTQHKEINCRILADHTAWQWLTDSYFL